MYLFDATVLLIYIHGYPAAYALHVLSTVCVRMLWIKSAVGLKAQTCERCWKISAWAWHKGLLPQLFISNSLKSTAGCSSAQSQIFTTPKHTSKYGQTKQLRSIPLANLSSTGSKGMQTRQWDSLGIRVLTIVCSLSRSLYSTWRKCSLFSCGWGNSCPKEIKSCLTSKITNHIQLFLFTTQQIQQILYIPKTLSKTKGFMHCLCCIIAYFLAHEHLPDTAQTQR